MKAKGYRKSLDNLGNVVSFENVSQNQFLERKLTYAATYGRSTPPLCFEFMVAVKIF